MDRVTKRKIKKVASGLRKASKTHAKQSRTLSSILKEEEVTWC